jgi:hypothetical protein
VVGRCRGPEGFDLLDHAVSGRDRRPAAVESPAQIVHEDAGTSARQLERVDAPEAPAGSGDERPAFELLIVRRWGSLASCPASDLSTRTDGS